MKSMQKDDALTATAIILAGGRSTRMGYDKGLMPFAGQPLIGHIADQLRPLFPRILVSGTDVCAAGGKYDFLGLPVVPDIEPGRGPLMGIVSCLLRSTDDLNFVTACDNPHLDIGIIHKLFDRADGADVVVPGRADGRYEPLFALYRKSVIHAAQAELAEGRGQVIAILDRVKTVRVEIAGTAWCTNLNTADDYRRATTQEIQNAGAQR